MLCVEDYLDALKWAEIIGGLDALSPAPTPMRGPGRLGRERPWIDFLAEDPAIRSNTRVCLKVVDPAIAALPAEAQAAFAKKIVDSGREGKASPTTSAPIATPRPACASGAARRWKPPTSKR